MNRSIRKIDLVVSLYIFGVMTAELMGAKTFPLLNFSWLHLNASVAVFVMPLLFTLVSTVVEVHGRERARSMVWSGLIVVALLFLYASLVTHLPSSRIFEPSEKAYDQVFGYSARIAAASLAAYTISELLDILVFARLKQRLHNKALWLRNNAANFVSQLADSTIFLSLAFYAPHQSFGSNSTFLLSLIVPYWLLRCSLSVIETPLVYLGVWWLRDTKRPVLVLEEA